MPARTLRCTFSTLFGSRWPPIAVRKHRPLRLRIASSPLPENRHQPQRHPQHTDTRSRLRRLHQQALTLHPDQASHRHAPDDAPNRHAARSTPAPHRSDSPYPAETAPNPADPLPRDLTPVQDRQPRATLLIRQRPRLATQRTLQRLHVPNRVEPHRIPADRVAAHTRRHRPAQLRHRVAGHPTPILDEVVDPRRRQLRQPQTTQPRQHMTRPAHADTAPPSAATADQLPPAASNDAASRSPPRRTSSRASSRAPPATNRLTQRRHQLPPRRRLRVPRRLQPPDEHPAHSGNTPSPTPDRSASPDSGCRRAHRPRAADQPSRSRPITQRRKPRLDVLRPITQKPANPPTRRTPPLHPPRIQRAHRHAQEVRHLLDRPQPIPRKINFDCHSAPRSRSLLCLVGCSASPDLGSLGLRPGPQGHSLRSCHYVIRCAHP